MSLTLGDCAKFNEIIEEYQYKELIFAKDIVLIPLALGVLYFVLRFLKKRQLEELQPYFLPGYFIRLAGIALFLIHHILIYKGGVDSFTFFWASSSVSKLFWINPSEAIGLVTGEITQVNYDLSFYYFMPNETFLLRMFTVISFLCFNSYLLISLAVGLFTFLGCWKIFVNFYHFFPRAKKALALSTLFIPSVFFWSSVYSKEMICIGAMGFLFDALMQIFVHKNRRILYMMLAFVYIYILINVKLYILLAFFPSLLLFLLLRKVQRVRLTLLRSMIVPASLIIFSLTFFYVFTLLGDKLAAFSFQKIIESTVVTYNYLSQEGFAESRYTLGEITPNLAGIGKLAPAGVNVTLFRPYIWEANKPITLLASLESLMTLLLTLWVLLKVGFAHFFKQISSNPMVAFCMVFSLVFAMAVGITSGNFGTLMRYKIPLMPFYYSALVIIYYSKIHAHHKPDLANEIPT